MENHSIIAKEWWRHKRIRYNIGLVVAGWSAFTLYAIVGWNLISPNDREFEITLFTILFQGIGYLFMMGIANIFYNLGYFVDLRYNKDNKESFRERLYNLGFWFSFGLPFLVPLFLFGQWVFLYHGMIPKPVEDF